MKKIQVIPLIILGILIILVALSPLLIKKKKIMFAPLPEIPKINNDCSNIEEVWNSIFTKPFDATVKTLNEIENNTCKKFLAFKNENQESWILWGEVKILSDSQGNRYNTTYIDAVNGLLDETAINLFNTDTEINNTMLVGVLVGGYILNRSESIDKQTAYLNFSSKFQNLFPDLNEENITEYDLHYDLGVFPSSNFENGSAVAIFKNKSYIFFMYKESVELPSLICTPNWTQFNSSCQPDDTIKFWYEDLNSCNTSVGKPVNQTRDCDYDGNGIIGNFTSFTDINLRLEIYIEDEPGEDVTEPLDDENTEVKFKEGNITIVEFDWDFDDEPLNMKNITIKKQSSSSDFGYLIVNGIEETKTIKVDRVISSNKVCIKDKYVNSISDISDDCNGTREYLLNCPGNLSRFECYISGNKFIVSGLRHSAVREFSPYTPPLPACIPKWNCTDWSSCVHNIKTRNCSNNCNNSIKIETQACSIACTPNWNCTAWMPEKCPKNETQTRSCIDLNNCRTDSGKPKETRSCEYKSSPWLIIIIVLVILIITAIILIFLLKKHPKPLPPAPPSLNAPTNRNAQRPFNINSIFFGFLLISLTT